MMCLQNRSSQLDSWNRYGVAGNMSDEIDLENDAEWLELVASFREHFWQVRVPELLTSWADARSLPIAHWPNELKRAIHGIAGSAGLIGYDAIGQHARATEQTWDANTLSAQAMMETIDGLVQAIADLACQQS